MPPQRTDLVLATNIPHVELCVLVCDSLDVEANGGDGCDVLVELELIENGCWGVLVAASYLLLHVRAGVLVFPAASRPSINRRISFDPKILPIIFEIEPPMLLVV